MYCTMLSRHIRSIVQQQHEASLSRNKCYCRQYNYRTWKSYFLDDNSKNPPIRILAKINIISKCRMSISCWGLIVYHLPYFIVSDYTKTLGKAGSCNWECLTYIPLNIQDVLKDQVQCSHHTKALGWDEKSNMERSTTYFRKNFGTNLMLYSSL